MPEINRLVDQASIINDLQRRLRVLESTARVLPTNDVVPALVPSNSTVVSTLPTILRPASYVSALANSTGISTVDGTTVSLPSASATGAVLQVIWSWRWVNWDLPGTGSLYYATDISTELEMDGSSLGLGWEVLTPPLAEVSASQHGYMIGVVETTPGDHSFQCRWHASSSGATSPVFHAMIADQALAITPLRFD